MGFAPIAPCTHKHGWRTFGIEPTRLKPQNPGEHSKWRKDQGYSDSLSKFSRTIQGKAYQDCLDNFGSRHRFIGFIDVDEFFVLHDPSLKSVNELLQRCGMCTLSLGWHCVATDSAVLFRFSAWLPGQRGGMCQGACISACCERCIMLFACNHRFESFGGLSIYWVNFGSSGLKQRTTDWVTRAYTKCTRLSSNYNTQFKSFINTAFGPTMYSPHRAAFKEAEREGRCGWGKCMT